MDLSNLNMDNIGSILSSLSDDDIDSLKSMAGSFFANANEQSSNETSNQQAPPPPKNEESSDFDFNLDFESIAKITSIMSKLSSKKKDPRSDLLLALRPLLSEEKQGKVDQATKIIQLLEILPLLKEMN
ncbi:MAG: hypothetical protein R3Y27_06595 [Clostridia bacterium]